MRTRARSSAVRVAIIGCGEVVRRFHLPVLAGHPDVHISAIVDVEPQPRAALAAAYGVSDVFSDIRQLYDARMDAAIVATPPCQHARQSIELLQRGLHVLVEKPIALNLSEAEQMVAAAERAGRVLAVGLYRRLLPSTRLARGLVQSRWLGRPLAFDHREGATYGWPARTLGNMLREAAGGGVLIDGGSHVIDQLAYILGHDASLLEYRDNALGGCESDCVLRLRFRIDGRRVEGTVELSRTRALRNTLEIVCENGTIELATDERHRVRVRPDELALCDGLTGAPREAELSLAWHGEGEKSWFEVFRAEIDDWLSAIRHGSRPLLDARSALTSMRLIDAGYANAELLAEPASTAPSRPASASPAFVRAGTPLVLVTGATGLVGCRVAELLAVEHGWRVRAAVHSPGNASRLARLPVEMKMGDLRKASDVQRLVAGCDAVVHCAMGTNWHDPSDVFEVNVEGTRRLVAAAVASGCNRFVHISTIAVYGLTPGMTIDDSTPTRPAKGDDYAQSKLMGEHVIRRHGGCGLCGVILRPTRIYGPFSKLFIVNPLQNLRRGKARNQPQRRRRPVADRVRGPRGRGHLPGARSVCG